MKMVRSLLLSLPLVGFALVGARDANACGGCVVPPDEDTQVTGHRMIFSTSMTQTTLYDQIEYSGSPESFAWFLPIHGQVDVGLSADAMFAFLGSASSVQVLAPPLNCPPAPAGCDYFGAEDGTGAGAGGGGGSNGGGVTIITQEVVGPYETVQLKASDPAALQTWLASHGYVVPDDVAPVVEAYQQEGFGFLAMKLVPGENVGAMRPVRVTSQGGALTMPLRMVAAGTGALTPITLFMVAEGRYQAANFPNVTFDSSAIVFHWDDYSSNYESLVKGLFQSSNGFGWLTQSAAPYSKSNLISQVQQVIDFNPGQSGWGDPEVEGSEATEATADLEALFAGMSENSIWLTRLHAQLTRPALGNDLNLEASPAQTEVSRTIQALYADGNAPACPDYSWCTGNSENGGDFNGIGQNDGFVKGKGSCAVSHDGDDDGTAALLASIGLAAAAVGIRRRRRSR